MVFLFEPWNQAKILIIEHLLLLFKTIPAKNVYLFQEKNKICKKDATRFQTNLQLEVKGKIEGLCRKKFQKNKQIKGEKKSEKTKYKSIISKCKNSIFGDDINFRHFCRSGFCR